MVRSFAFVLALGVAFAAPAARAASGPDAPVAQPANPNLAPAPTTPSGVSLHASERTGLGLHLGVGIAAGVLTVPAGLYLASGLGSLSNALVWAALPALLAYGLVAPTLTTLAAYLIGNWNDPGRYGFALPWLVSVVLNAGLMLAAGFGGMSIGMPVQILLFGLLDGVLIGGASVGTMRLFEKKPSAASAIRSFVPGVGDTAFVPVTAVGF